MNLPSSYPFFERVSTCVARACKAKAKEGHLCRRHYRSLPTSERRVLWRFYVSEKEEDIGAGLEILRRMIEKQRCAGCREWLEPEEFEGERRCRTCRGEVLEAWAATG